jgi:hypothetical protein
MTLKEILKRLEETGYVKMVYCYTHDKFFEEGWYVIAVDKPILNDVKVYIEDRCLVVGNERIEDFDYWYTPITSGSLYEIAKCLQERDVVIPEDLLFEIALLAKEGNDYRNHRVMPCDTGKSCWCDLATSGDCPEHY